MDFKATLEERTSQKGNKYKCIVVKITDNIEKMVFLTQAEVELIELKKTDNLYNKLGK